MEKNLKEIKHFIEIEIDTAKARKKEQNSVYDGVNVGIVQANQLNDRHIWFCERILEMTNEREQT